MLDCSSETGEIDEKMSSAAPSPKRVILWSALRSGSSVFARSFMQRTDTHVFYENLFDAYYLGPERRSTNYGADSFQWEGIDFSKRTYADVYAEFLGIADEGVSLVLAKEMAYYVVPPGAEGQPPVVEWRPEWDEFEHMFLVRSPHKQVPSLVRVMTQQDHTPGLNPVEFDPAEVGVEQLHALFHAVRQRIGRTPLLVDVEDVWRNPGATLRSCCDHLGLTFDEAMLSWPRGWRREFRYWNDEWVRDVFASVGFDHGGGSTERPQAPCKSSEAAAAAPSQQLPDCMQIAMDAAAPLHAELLTYKVLVPCDRSC